ncbi:uridine phosphorylase 1 isoform X2 [Rhipicephalus microplus]|uniref:uridine phosphorylase 1 isoform X2 n=1 Tax=Rhipicephalus microplus TaxID=6941 RepID=UPI003F6C1B82
MLSAAAGGLSRIPPPRQEDGGESPLPRDRHYSSSRPSQQPVAVAGSWPSSESEPPASAMENYEPLPPPQSQATREPVCLCSRDENGNGDTEGYVQLRNPHLANLSSDHLYHLALSTTTHSLVDMFGDVKFVCMGGTPSRMEQFARLAKEKLGLKLPTGTDLCDLSHYAGRYSMYKVGPLLSISHGMGAPSLSILLHEVFKLLHYARCRDVLVIRIGTSGGVGVPPGSVVVSTGAVNGLLREELDMHVLGKLVSRPAKLDAKLAEEIAAEARRSLSGVNVVLGKTMCADDFYEGQGRLDGAFCDYTDREKLQFLEQLRSIGVVNIEMEATLFAAMCHHAGIKGAVVCVTLLDRLKGDQVTEPKSVMSEWQLRPQHVVLRFIQHRLATAGSSS